MTGLLDDLLPRTVRVACDPIRDRMAEIFEPERAIVATAVDKRKREFSTGRWLARPLLESFGHAHFAVLRADDRLPLWPEDLVGSITHAGEMCAVAVARAVDCGGLGIDLEPDAPIEAEIERRVCFGAERDWVGALGDAERGRRARIVFSVKEAVYKAFYPRTRTFWAFEDVSVEIDLETASWRAALPPSAGTDSARGSVVRRDGWIVSAIALPPR